MPNLTITTSQARRFLLTYQRLMPPHTLQAKEGALAFLHHVRTIQFDPLNIVGRNPDLVLQSRVSDYRPDMLADLLYEDRELVDGWDKMMAIYCVEDWPLMTRRRQAAREHRRSAEEVDGAIDAVRQALQERGPLSSIDLEHGEAVSWHWGPTRLARAILESMYNWGEVVVHHKVNTRRVFDFTHRLLPAEILDAPDPFETEEQYLEAYLLRRLGNVGLLWERAGNAWVGMPGAKAKDRKHRLDRMVEDGRVIRLAVEGVRTTFVMRASELPLLEEALGMAGSGPMSQPGAALLAPLDNLMWHRTMVEALFGFDYRWEVYTPAVKRKYGYYVLPVLYGDQLVARCEPVRDPDGTSLLVKNWWWQDGVEPDAEMRRALRQMMARFCAYQSCTNLRLAPAADERVAFLAD